MGWWYGMIKISVQNSYPLSKDPRKPLATFPLIQSVNNRVSVVTVWSTTNLCFDSFPEYFWGTSTRSKHHQDDTARLTFAPASCCLWRLQPAEAGFVIGRLFPRQWQVHKHTSNSKCTKYTNTKYNHVVGIVICSWLKIRKSGFTLWFSVVSANNSHVSSEEQENTKIQ